MAKISDISTFFKTSIDESEADAIEALEAQLSRIMPGGVYWDRTSDEEEGSVVWRFYNSNRSPYELEIWLQLHKPGYLVRSGHFESKFRGQRWEYWDAENRTSKASEAAAAIKAAVQKKPHYLISDRCSNHNTYYCEEKAMKRDADVEAIRLSIRRILFEEAAPTALSNVGAIVDDMMSGFKDVLVAIKGDQQIAKEVAAAADESGLTVDDVEPINEGFGSWLKSLGKFFARGYKWIVKIAPNLLKKIHAVTVFLDPLKIPLDFREWIIRAVLPDMALAVGVGFLVGTPLGWGAIIAGIIIHALIVGAIFVARSVLKGKVGKDVFPDADKVATGKTTDLGARISLVVLQVLSAPKMSLIAMLFNAVYETINKNIKSASSGYKGKSKGSKKLKASKKPAHA